MLLTRSASRGGPSLAVPSPRIRRLVCRVAVGVLALLVGAPAASAQPTRQVPVESLVYDLKNPDPVRRREAATLIGQNKVQSATPDLVAAVHDSDPAVRRAISIALQQVQDPRALPGFVALAGDTEKDIRERAIDGMTLAYLPRESGLLTTLTKVATFFNPASDESGDLVIEPDLAVDPSVVQAVDGRLADPDPGIRAKAARSIGILRGRAAIPALLVIVKEDRSNTARFEAARALRKIGDPSVGDELLKLITYSDAKVRNEVVFALGRLRYTPAVPELTRLYEREAAVPAKQMDRVFRERLLGALAFIGDPSSKALFMREKISTDPALALRANEGLARIADATTLEEISRDRLQQKDARILTAQAWALYRLGRKEFLTAVVDALGSKRTYDQAREYLLEQRSDDIPDLFPLTTHADPGVRGALAEILGLLGDGRATSALRELTRDPSAQVATAASLALQRVNKRTAS